MKINNLYKKYLEQNKLDEKTMGPVEKKERKLTFLNGVMLGLAFVTTITEDEETTPAKKTTALAALASETLAEINKTKEQ